MIIYGKNTVKEAILASRLVYIVYIDKKFTDRAIFNLIEQNKIKYKRVNKHELNELTNNGIHQGIVAEVEDYIYSELETLFDGKEKRVVILDRIVDPQNFGAIIRTAEIAGIDALIVGAKGQVKITPTVTKVSSGALEYLKIIEVNNLIKVVEVLKENNFVVVGATPDGEVGFKVEDDKSVALIIGNEGIGISYNLKNSCDGLVKIPMKGKTKSLNASVAAALLIYEMMGLFKE